MKLTKGKISKLYSKNRQSVKRRKNCKKKTNKSKTFGKKRNINLANKSLKQVYFRKNGDNNIVPEYDNRIEGGFRMPYKKNKKNKPLPNESSGIEMTSLGESVNNPLQNQDVVPQVDNSSLIAPSSENISAVDSSIAQPLGDVPVVNESLAVDVPPVEEPLVETPVLEEPLVETPVLEEPLVETPVLEEPLIETPVLEEPLIETPVPDAVAQVPQDNDSIIGKSFKIILDYSLEKLASEIKNNKNCENIIQNGFNANKIAANSMASVEEPAAETPPPAEEPVVETPPAEEPAGETQSLPSNGGKRRKTRKFKLTNKNKKTRTKR